MNPTEIQLTRQKFSSALSVESEFSCYNEPGIFRDQLTHELVSHVMTAAVGEFSGVKKFPRPTFFEWFFRRPREFSYTIRAEDMPFDQSKFKGKEHARLYFFNGDTHDQP